MARKRSARVLMALAAGVLALAACDNGPSTPALPAVEPDAPAPEAAPPEVAAPETAPEEAAPVEPQAAEPVAEAAPAGDWLLFATSQSGVVADALWAVGEDLSAARPLVSGVQIAVPIDWDLSAAVSPDGRNLAYLTTSDPFGLQGLALNLLDLAAGETRAVTALTTPATEPDAADPIGDPRLDIVRAIAEVNSLAWSPDGQRLAFVGAMNGTSADLYVYSLADGAITQLTDGAGQALAPTWSPDGRWIAHLAVGGLGTGAGYDVQGAWAAAADGSEVKLLYEPDSGAEVWVAWTGPDTLLLHSWLPMCGPESLRTLAIDSGEVHVLWPTPFSQVAADPASGAALITVDQYTAACGMPGEMGTFLVNPDGTWAKVDDGDSYQPVWSEAAGAFFALAGDGAIRVSLDGQVEALTSPARVVPIVAPGGEVLAFASALPDESGLWVGPDAETVTLVTGDPVVFPTWSPDGEQLVYFSGEALYAAAAPDFAPRLVAEGVGVTDVRPVWVSP